MEKHVIVIEYIGEEPNFEAVQAAVLAIGQHVHMAEQQISPIALNEQDIAKALYLLGMLKGVETKSPLSVEIKKRKLNKKSLVDAFVKALENVEDV